MKRPMTVSSILNEDLSNKRLEADNSFEVIEHAPAHDIGNESSMMMRDTTNRWIAALGSEVHQLAELLKETKCECSKKTSDGESLTSRELSGVSTRLEQVDAKITDLNSAVGDLKSETQLLHRAIGEWLELWREVQAEYVATLRAAA